MTFLIDNNGIIRGWNVADTKEDSEAIIKEIGNNLLIPYFQQLTIEDRNAYTDQALFIFFNYMIAHYEKFHDQMTFENKRNLFFNICRSVSFLDWQVITGKSESGIADEYTISHVKGFEENNLFRDLKFLQILTAYNPPKPSSPDFYGRASEEEVASLMHDMTRALKLVAKTESDSTLENERRVEVRQQFQSVTSYPHIFSIASYYREKLRCEDAINALDVVVPIIEKYLAGNIFREHRDLVFLVFRVISIIGEFASQKNMSKQTRLDFPELTAELEKIKKLADLIVKPNQTGDFTGYADLFYNIDQLIIHWGALLWDLNYVRSGLQQILVGLNNLVTYDARLEYYTHFPARSYLSEELIIYLQGYCGYYFPDIKGEYFEYLCEVFSSPDNHRTHLTAILQIAKEVYPNQEFGEIMRGGASVARNDLRQALEAYEPPEQPTGGLLTEVYNIQDQLSNYGCNNPFAILRQEVANFRAFLGNNLLAVGGFSDNPIGFDYDQLYVRESNLVVRIAGNGQTIEVTVAIPANLRMDAVYACHQINTYSQSKNFYKLILPKELLGYGPDFILGRFANNLAILDRLQNNLEFLSAVIQMGRMAKLWIFLIDDENKLVAEFYLKTLYKLADHDNVEHSKEFRALRDGIRHFEDNLLVTEVETDIEGIYANYIYKTFEQDAFNVTGLLGLAE